MRRSAPVGLLLATLTACTRPPAPPAPRELPPPPSEVGRPATPPTTLPPVPPQAARPPIPPPPVPTRRPVAPAERGEGFGSGTRGGEGGRFIPVHQPTEEALQRAIVDANKTGNATIELPPYGRIEITKALPRLIRPRITIEGRGATLDGSRLVREVALLDIRTHDVIVRDLRLRNGYDNLRIQGDDAADILVTHVSSTGAADDGISIGYGAHDVTVQWSFLAGNTRSLFCKYGKTTRISIHHTWMQKAWIRSPLVSGAVVADLRNVIVEDWGEWGARFEDGASGNVVNSLFVLSPRAQSIGGKPDSALRAVQAGPVHAAGNVFRGARSAVADGAETPVRAAPVATQDVGAMEAAVRGRAGCLPRDEIDQAYIALKDAWHVGRSEPLRLSFRPPGRAAVDPSTTRPLARD
jgi:hypothetical protein